MGGLLWKIVAIAMTLIQLTHGVVINSKKPQGTRLKRIYEDAWYDWKLGSWTGEKDAVYNRNADANRNFSLAYFDNYEKTIVIKVATTYYQDQKRLKDAHLDMYETCKFDFNATKDDLAIITSLRLWAKDDIYQAFFTWYKHGDETSERVDSVNTVTCHDVEKKRKELKEKEKESLKEKEGLRAPEQAATATNGTADAPQNVDVTKVAIPKGYYFMREYNEEESKAHIRYADMERSTVTDVATIAHPAGKNVKGESMALGKYGICWQVDRTVTCSQGPLDNSGQPIKQWATLLLLDAARYIGVLNYAEDKMLVLLGYCSQRNHCPYVELIEVRPDGQVFRHDDIHYGFGFRGFPDKITVDMLHDPEKKQVCFISVVRDGYHLFKYRRTCFEEQKV